MFPRTHRFSSLSIVAVFLFLVGCNFRPTTQEYKDSYAHLEEPLPSTETFHESDYYIVFLVDARHFDYSSSDALLKTMVKNPIDGSKNGNVGHAWVYLRGLQDGNPITIEGGHSGEFGEVQPKYFDGVTDYIQYGYLDPTPEQKKHPRHEPNPIKYLWASQMDGIFQKGSGRHVPSFGAKVDLTEEQYLAVMDFIHPRNYDYKDFSVTRNQCSAFLAKIGAVIDFPLEHTMTIAVAPVTEVAGKKVQLWEDEQYSSITIGSPDVIERSLMEAVREGRAEQVTEWYLATHPESKPSKIKRTFETIYLFPVRFGRYVMFR